MYELERVLRVRDGFLCSKSATYDGAVLLWQWWHKQAIVIGHSWCICVVSDCYVVWVGARMNVVDGMHALQSILS